MYTEIKGNLFDSKDSLAHCVSMDFKMGAGIALSFRNKFDSIDDLKKQNKQVGDIAVLKDNNRFIYYLITKEKYYNKPTYDNLKSTLLKLKDHMDINKIDTLSIPKIGCGLDKLDWSIVSKMIKEILKDKKVTCYMI